MRSSIKYGSYRSCGGVVTTGAGSVVEFTTDLTPLIAETSAVNAVSFTSPVIVAMPSFTSTVAPAIDGLALMASSTFALMSASFGLQLAKVKVAATTTIDNTLVHF
ncbi:MAG: hypothetical protein WDM90_24680 [Ferruginibacter sp.]